MLGSPTQLSLPLKAEEIMGESVKAAIELAEKKLCAVKSDDTMRFCTGLAGPSLLLID